MPIRYKSGGTVWSGPVANGNFHFKWGGEDWISPAYVKVKSGDVGTGDWVDTGYLGKPGVPTGVHVYDWSFSQIRCGWSPPASGPTPTGYDIYMTDSTGNLTTPLDSKTDTASPSPYFTVGEDWQVAFFVRSKGPGGLVSDWAQGWYLNPAANDYRLSSRALIGHTRTSHYVTENRTRGWSSESVTGYRNKDEPFWAGVPSNVLLTGMHWRNMGTPQSSVVAPGTNRQVYWIFNNSDWGPITNELGTVYTGNSTDWPFNNQGDGRAWGVVARGSGWSTTGNSFYQIYVDEFHLSGTETYQVSVEVVDRAYQDNNYW